jgi:two-component system, OmpR family, sensor kinase
VRSLRAREFAAILLAVVASVGVTLVVAVVLVRSSARHEALKSLARQAALIAAQEQGAKLTSLGVFFDTQQERATILTTAQAALLLPPAGGDALKAGNPAQGSVDVGGTHYLYAAHPDGKRAVVLLSAAKLEASDLQPYTIAFAIAAAVGAAIAAAAAFLLARAVARPIERVSDASLALAAGERPGPLPETGSTEVAALAESFNRLADDLDRAKAAERSFLLSVSHELKTPLAAIRGHGEDLLDLARLNQRSFSVQPHEVDLAALAVDAVARHRAESIKVEVGLHAETNGPAPALADPDRTLQVLSNLIENALRSTPSGGSVTITAHPGVLTVADTGPGLAPEELPHAFERFFLYTRYARHRAVGTGLGLAIVKELTEAMGGTIAVAGASGQGTIFTVRLPEGPPLDERRPSDHITRSSDHS